MHYLKRHRVPWLVLVAIALAIYGCSFLYVVQLEGSVINGADKSPIAGAMITVKMLHADKVICVSDANGKWKYNNRVTNPFHSKDEEQRMHLPVQLEIEAHGRTFEVEANVPLPEHGRTIYGFLLTTLDLGPN